jgi:hypothetical protein
MPYNGFTIEEMTDVSGIPFTMISKKPYASFEVIEVTYGEEGEVYPCFKYAIFGDQIVGFNSLLFKPQLLDIDKIKSIRVW